MLEKIKKHKKLMIAIVVIVIIAIVIGILVHRMRQSASEITQVDSGIQAFTLQKQDMSSSVSTSGTVESSNVTEVYDRGFQCHQGTQRISGRSCGKGTGALHL